MVAYMTQNLEVFKGAKILEIGTGSGYQASILAYLGAEVYTIERIEKLYKKAQENIKQVEDILNKKLNIKFFLSDGSIGLKKEAPFDRIIITAAAIFNQTKHFLDQSLNSLLSKRMKSIKQI